ncbi:Crp/Fnr family transcriptional regulator [Rhodobacteraceae bacterium LMO-12]|nr:Crp/Fnr family transcriptional regulator [Rhodobacteraceae bacterium LMO-JJ12]
MKKLSMLKCRDCPLHEHAALAAFSPEDFEVTQALKAGEMQIEAGTPLLAVGAKVPQLFTVREGLGIRYKTLPEGERQVINFVFPGDFLGLQAAVMGEVQYSVEASTDMKLCVFDRASLWKLFRNSPGRSYDLTWMAAVDEYMVAEALTSVGQQDAMGRITWGLLRLYNRAAAVDLLRADDGAAPLPFRQQDLADALGLSLVHTNKTLTRLREKDIVDWSKGWLRVIDREAMIALAGSDASLPESRPFI